ncbi:hypothetical protein RSOLAG22IIIB_13466 [Rhizoctonia solani]|uniref:DUF6532 domain-containing protein n=1 Tax=Rhizoctonia solani TaxID=456999 RepID=A0A0K6FMU1_9AGAM|nr:hypothetical protein RSOLAG22IIIB_13466 [Rhizoctonia solani]
MNEITASSILDHIDNSSATNTNPSSTFITPTRTEAIELRRSDRPCARSSRAKEGGYDKQLAVNKQRAARAGRTRSRNEKARSDTGSIGVGFTSAASETDNDGRDPSPSPTPIATASELEAQDTRANLQEKITRKLHQVIENSDTQMLMAVDEAISTDPAYASQPEEQDPEARFLSPVVVGAGGGFHLDHPTHRSRNSRTYRNLKGVPRTIATPDSPTLTEPTQLENDPDPPCIQPFPLSQGDAPPLPLDPIYGLNSRFFAVGSTSGLLLGYPDGQDTRRSLSHVPRDKTPATSQPSSAHSPAPSLTRELRSDGTSNFNRPLGNEGSISRITTSSKSLGDPIPTLSPAPQSQGKRPLETPATPLPARKRPTVSQPTPGGRAYNGRLNIIEINSERVSTTFNRSRETSRRTACSGRKGKDTTRTRACACATHPQRTGNDHLDLLDGPDEGELVTESAAKGVLIENPEYRKPTRLDLVGYERAIWKDVFEATWALSMGEGNFQARATFASWTDGCFAKLIELKVPNLDPDTTIMSDTMKTVLLNNFPNARYQDYVRVRDYVRDHFQLKDPATDDECEATKIKVGKIYPNYFHYRHYEDDRTDPYEGEILYIALKAMFFFGPKAIGAKYPALFRRSDDPKDERKYLAVLAYVATMVQFCLREWSEGFFNKDTLNATTEHSIWVCHFDGLKNVALCARQRLTDTYDEWVQNAYDASQAQTKFTKKRYVQAVVLPRDVRPDTPSPSPISHGDH